jgi:hypothetical protein
MAKRVASWITPARARIEPILDVDEPGGIWTDTSGP